MPLGHSHNKKPKHQEGSESEEEDDSSDSEELEEESSESEEEAPSMDMPQTGHKISKPKCEDVILLLRFAAFLVLWFLHINACASDIYLKGPIGEHCGYLSILVFFASYGVLSLKSRMLQ